MDKRRIIFLTGATGLVGSYLLKIFLQNGHKVYALARSNNYKSAQNRVRDILEFWDKKVLKDNFNNLVILEGDISKTDLGLNIKAGWLLKKEIDEIFHCAAMIGFNQSLEDIRRINVGGTRNVLEFAKECNEEGKLRKINHMSTAYVCGNHRGEFSENDLDVGQKFDTTYEQTKFEAEKMVENYRIKGLWVDIFRPVIVIGESKTGKTVSFQQSFYQLIHIWNSEIFNYFPGNNFFINTVFVDELSKSIYSISSKTTIRNKNYHPFNLNPTSLKKIINISSKFLQFKKPKLVSRNEFFKKKSYSCSKNASKE